MTTPLTHCAGCGRPMPLAHCPPGVTMFCSEACWTEHMEIV